MGISSMRFALSEASDRGYMRFIQNPSIKNVGNQNGLIVVPRIANLNRNGNVVTTRAKGNGVGIQLQAEEFDLMTAVGDINKIEEVNANYILMANLQQASTSGTQTDKALVYNSDGSTEVHHYENCYDNDILNIFTQKEQYTELLELITEPHPVQQNNNNVIFVESCMEHSGGTVEQHPATVEKTHACFESLYNNLVTDVEKVNTFNHKMKETNADLTTELARYKGQEKRLKADITTGVNQIVTIFLIKSSIHLLDQIDITSLIHIEFRKSPTVVLFDDDTGRMFWQDLNVLARS
ncbi:hypothetical protein Tco_0830228 [Tanacetum coccineum]